MNIKTVLFLVVLCFIVGMVLGFSINKKPEECVSTITPKLVVYDTIIKVKKDTIRIPVDRVRYFTKRDTLIINDTFEYDDTKVIPPRISDCVSFPLLLSDSSLIEVTECSTEGLPNDLTYDAKYIDKREKIRVIENTRVDTLKHSAKKIGFSIGPSAGIGIDINNVERPAYFVGVTLTWGLRF